MFWECEAEFLGRSAEFLEYDAVFLGATRCFGGATRHATSLQRAQGLYWRAAVGVVQVGFWSAMRCF